MNSNIQDNKATATAFYDLAFNQKRPDEAVARYVGKTYIQHNPNFADGPQAFIDAVKAWVGACPSLRTEVKRIIAEDDFVVTHVFIKQHEKDMGTAAIDIFRFENGKIVEHWDVTSAIPEKSANNNTMF
ncbi:MAG: ester cyclase [Nitrospirae bacterium]|nr:ester cyclase [Nitrospirota bacterium]